MKHILSITIILTILFSKSIYTQSWNGVFVGINLYSGDYNNLVYCVKDANDIIAVLSMCRWNENNMIPILDRQATGSYIKSKIAAMPTTQGNTNLFYFAGHGDSQTLPGTGPHYDGIIATDGVIYSPRELQSDLHNHNQSAVFIDACGSGIFPNYMTCGVVASACRDDEPAKEGPGYSDGVQNGFYTYYLKQYLSYSVNTAEEVAVQARDATKARWGQSPQVKDNFVGYLSLYNAPNTTEGHLTRNETWSVPSCLTGDVDLNGTKLTLCTGFI